MMKVVILAGGYGTRISEESILKPKPMVNIGDMPILWHIMKIYSYYGFCDFIICAGYKQDVIKEWFAHYYLCSSDLSFDFTEQNKVLIHNSVSEPWRVTVVDTGMATMTGGRVKRIQSYIGEEDFLLTYGDAVSDVNINNLVDFHKSHGKCMTLTTVSIAQQKGVLEINDDNTICSFREKDSCDGAIINGGFMACKPRLFDYLHDDSTILEQSPIQTLASEGELKSFYHKGFWQCMDTMREKMYLESLWNSKKAPWKVW